MKYNISVFTDIGTEREVNQDRALVNNNVLESGFYHLTEQTNCFCFVADGIGGGIRGEIASQFILDKISGLKDDFMNLNDSHIKENILKINKDLISYSKSIPEYFGTGSTLSGLIISQDQNSLTLNAGDSEIRVLRNGMFFQITEDQVFDDSQEGSPLMSYFGGKEDRLELSLTPSLRSISTNDIYVIASDGLFGSLLPKKVKEILTEDQTLSEKSELILKTALSTGSDDNISCILIEVI